MEEVQSGVCDCELKSVVGRQSLRDGNVINAPGTGSITMDERQSHSPLAEVQHPTKQRRGVRPSTSPSPDLMAGSESFLARTADFTQEDNRTRAERYLHLTF